MPRAIPRGPVFRIDGIEPDTDLAWFYAGPWGQREFWREVARVGLELKDKSLARGLDIHGKKMQISEKTRQNRRSAMGPAYYRAPALTPSFEASRTRSYLRAEPDATGVTFFWRYDPRTRDSWGVILDYQKRAGRNVIGMSQLDLNRVARHMERWWAANRLRLAMRGTARRLVTGEVLSISRPLVVQPVAPINRVRPQPVPLPPVVVDLSQYTLLNGSAAQIERAAAAGTFTGFRRRTGGPSPLFKKR
jgi:hypothetical protein